MKDVKKVTPFFTDDRGEMSHLIPEDAKIQGVLLITCKKGAIRANHYHKKDSHYSYILQGSMEYSWRDRRIKNSKMQSVIVRAGDVVYSPPMVDHAMRFLEDSAFIAFAAKPRARKDYESDTVRVDLIQ